MGEIKGYNIGGTVVPFMDTDKYPTHDSKYGKGGFKSVPNFEDIALIPKERLSSNGTLVYVESTKKYYMVGANGVPTPTFGDYVFITKIRIGEIINLASVPNSSKPDVTSDDRKCIRETSDAILGGKQIYVDDVIDAGSLRFKIRGPLMFEHKKVDEDFFHPLEHVRMSLFGCSTKGINYLYTLTSTFGQRPGVPDSWNVTIKNLNDNSQVYQTSLNLEEIYDNSNANYNGSCAKVRG